VVPPKKVGAVNLRLLDIVFSAVGLVVGSPLLLVLFLVGVFDTGSPLFRQLRVGRYQQPFVLIKFRTMAADTQSVATHLVNSAAVTRLGRFLRQTKLDELPQLWNVFRGHMSLVGPRPCLPNQEELIAERSALDVFNVRPGITGLAQISGIDMSTPRLLAETDARMVQNLTLFTYFKYIFKTVTGAGRGDRVQHK
jgi:O-antigen biosynthesis protein WbqP